MGLALKPVARLALTFVVVWFYHGLTAPLLDDALQVLAVVVLAIPTWLLVSRVLFPLEGSVLDG
jgi:hypothetical protein